MVWIGNKKWNKPLPLTEQHVTMAVSEDGFYAPAVGRGLQCCMVWKNFFFAGIVTGLHMVASRRVQLIE
jgi:hypothetical protein